MPAPPAAITWFTHVTRLLTAGRRFRAHAPDNPAFLDAARRQLDAIRVQEGDAAAHNLARLFRDRCRTEPVSGYFHLLDQYTGEDDNH